MTARNPAVVESRGVRGAAYSVLTPANRYASRLPNLRDALVYKLVTPRLAPARFAFLSALTPVRASRCRRQAARADPTAEFS